MTPHRRRSPRWPHHPGPPPRTGIGQFIAATMLFVVGVGLLSGANDPHLSVGWKLFWALAGGLLLMFVPALIIDSATKAAVARLRQEMPVPIEPGPGMVAEYVVRRPSEPVTLPALDPTFGPQRDTPDGEAP